MQPFVSLHLVTALVSGTLSILIWRRRSALGRRPFALLMAGVTIWALAYGLELAGTSFASMRWWLWVEYLGIATAPVCWLIFALHFAGYGAWLTRSRMALLFLIPALTILLNGTNATHGLYYRRIAIDNRGPFPLLDLTPGPWYWVHISSSLLLLIGGSLVLLQLWRNTARPYRGQIASVVAGAYVPVIMTLAYLAGLRPFGHLDLTPLALTLTGALVANGLLRHSLFDLAPIARTHLFAQLADAVIVLDLRGRIVDHNLAAQRWLGVAVGQSLPPALALLAEPTDASAPPTTALIPLAGAEPRTVEVQRSPLHDQRCQPIGSILVLRDVTTRAALERDREQLIARLTAQAKALEQAVNARAQAEQALRAERDFALQVMQTMGEGLTVTDHDGRFTFVNDAYARLFGYTSAELIGRSPLELTVADDHTTLQAAREARARGERSTYLTQLRRADGLPVHVQITGTPRLIDGQVAGAVAVITDLTPHLTAEAELRSAEQTLRSFFDSAGVMMGIVEPLDDDIIHIADNAVAAAFFGTTVAAMAGLRASELGVPRVTIQRWLVAYRETVETGQPVQFDYAHETPTGQIWLSATVCLIEPAPGGRMRCSYVATDISERIHTEHVLREARQFLQATLDALSAHLAILNTEGTILAVNAAWQEFAAANGGRDEVGSNYLQVCDASTGAEAPLAAAGIRAVRDGTLPSFALEYPCSSPEEVRWFSMRVTRFAWNVSVRLVVAHTDITQRKLAEEALQVSETRLRTLVQHIPDAAVLLFDHELRFLVADGPGLAALGSSRETMEGHTLAEVLPPALAATLAQPYQATLGGRPPEELELVVGERIYGCQFAAVRDGGGAVVAGLSLAMDITRLRRDEAERLALQQRLLETQRLESIGTLAGGVAHDFNNVLMAVLGHAELLRLDLPPGSPLDSSVEAIIAGAQRAAGLTSQLLAYAGKGRVLLQPVNLNDLICEVLALSRTTLHQQAQICIRLADALPAVEADVVQLHQVVLNLLLNASEALGEDEGTIVVETAAEYLDVAALRGLLLGEELPAGCYVRLTVRDSGQGMDAETQARMFEPFFSTRFTGRGLGLAAVHGIVRSHRGVIQVRSAPGQGTTVQIWLPTTAEAALAEPSDQVATGRGRGTVLIIDDEALVRTVARRMMERLGFGVQEAESGAAGLALLAERGVGLATVLLDLTMPEMGGEAVAREIARRHPGVRVVLMSGYSAEEIRQRYDDLPIAGVLQKPFSSEVLRNALEPV